LALGLAGRSFANARGDDWKQRNGMQQVQMFQQKSICDDMKTASPSRFTARHPITNHHVCFSIAGWLASGEGVLIKVVIE
jgi:hypothetical protein